MVKFKVMKADACISICATYRKAVQFYMENDADAIYELDSNDGANAKCVTMKLKEAS